MSDFDDSDEGGLYDFDQLDEVVYSDDERVDDFDLDDFDDSDSTDAAAPPLTTKQSDSNEFTWPVSVEIRVRRFLCLGNEAGRYNAVDKQLTIQNATSVVQMIHNDKGVELVTLLKTLNEERLAAKPGPTLFVLAMCTKYEPPKEIKIKLKKREKMQRAAYGAIQTLCKLPNDLFLFVDYCEKIALNTGWGRSHRSAMEKWYLSKSPEELAMFVTKYRRGSGWSHRDIIRLAHPKPKSVVSMVDRRDLLSEGEEGRQRRLDDLAMKGEQFNDIFCYIVGGYNKMINRSNKRKADVQAGTNDDTPAPKCIKLLEAVEVVKKLTEGEGERAAELIEEEQLAREHIPPQLLKQRSVWDALVKKMPFTSLLSNLNKLTSLGCLGNNDDEALQTTADVCARLRREQEFENAHLHPFNVLLALHMYSSGAKGCNPSKDIECALIDCVSLAFINAKPTNKRFLMALDVSGSMTKNVTKLGVTCRDAASALILSNMRIEEKCQTMTFCHKLESLAITKDMSVKEVSELVTGLPFGRTDCALPILYALNEKKEIDVFIVFTDNPTFWGEVHPYIALKKYQASLNLPNARLIVMGLGGNEFSIANDVNMLDVVGLDAVTPQIINNFVLGKI